VVRRRVAGGIAGVEKSCVAGSIASLGNNRCGATKTCRRGRHRGRREEESCRGPRLAERRIWATWSRKKDSCIGRVDMVGRGKGEEREGVRRWRPAGVERCRRRLWWREG
jgi:hypothetical protein